MIARIIKKVYQISDISFYFEGGMVMRDEVYSFI